MGISLARTNKAAEYAAEEEEGNCLVAEVSGVDEESDEDKLAVKL